MQYRFAGCSIDIDRHEFSRAGAVVRLEPQVFDLLLVLAERAGKLVTHQDLIDTVWRGLNVSDATISSRISAARTAVGDNGRDQHVIETVSRRGFRLISPVDVIAETVAEAACAQPVAAPEIQFAKSADGTRIAFAASGDGPPLLRVAHWLSHLEMDWHSPIWRPLIDILSARHRLYRYDQRGTGLSGRSIGSGGLEHFMADLRAVADAAGLARFSIFAASQGGPVALRFAAEYPDRVDRIVLLGAYAEGRLFRDKSPEDTDEETILSLIRSGWGRKGSTFVRAFSSLFMPDATPEQVDHFVDVQLETASPENAVALRQAIDRFLITDILHKVTAPVLLLHARGDVIHPIAQSRLLASELPDARLVVLDSNNHVPLPQHLSWDVMVAECESFLRA